MNGPAITVLTAARNASHCVAETVESIRQQTFEDWEHIVVDDASDDSTATLVEELGSQDPRLRLIRRGSRGGPFAAANEGLLSARGKWIAVIDADDLAVPHRLATQLAFLENRADVDACITPWQAFMDHAVIPGTVERIPHRADVLRWYLLLFAFASHSSLFISRDALVARGGYHELPAAQDFRLVSELCRAGRLAVIPEVLAIVRTHPIEEAGRWGDLELRCAMDVMREHVMDVAGQSWTDADLEMLWLAGHFKPVPLNRGIDVIKRWARLWRSDPALDRDARRDLAYLYSLHVWRLMNAFESLSAGDRMKAVGRAGPLALVRGMRERRRYEQTVRELETTAP